MVPTLSTHFKEVVSAVEDLILSEVNVKQVEYITDDSGILVKRIKANFKTLGPKYGKLMKQLGGAINQLSQEEIRELESENRFLLKLGDQDIEIGTEDVEITTEDIPGWSVANQNHITVALDLTITPALQEEGLARELINRIQNFRKDKGLEVTDRIQLHVERDEQTEKAFENFKEYICAETLANMFIEKNIQNGDAETFELIDGIKVKMALKKE